MEVQQDPTGTRVSFVLGATPRSEHTTGASLPLEVQLVQSFTQQNRDLTEQMVQSYEAGDATTGSLTTFWQDPFCMQDFRQPRLGKFMPRVLFAVLWYYFCVYMNNLSQAWLQRHMAGFYESEWGYSAGNFSASQAWLKTHRPDIFAQKWGDTSPNATKSFAPESMQKFYQNTTVTLFDLSYLFLPEIPTSFYADMFAGCSAMFGFVRFVLVPGPLSLRWTFLCRVLFVWGTLFLWRAFTIVVTPLPNPYHKCEPKVTFPYSIWKEAFANLPGVWWYSELTCQDVLFSGHTAMGTLWTRFAMDYCEKVPWFGGPLKRPWIYHSIRAMAYLWLLFGWCAIVLSHFHYTVDVLVGALLTFTLYRFYHSRIHEISFDVERQFEQPFTSFIRWFEKHALDLRLWRRQAQTLIEAHAASFA